VAGHIMTGAAIGVFDLMLWRALTGVGYAIVTMACQSYISASLGQDNRARGLGVFVGAVLTAGICGTALGGVLAERVGYRGTFFISAALVVLAGLLVSRLLASESAAPGEPVVRRSMLRLFANWRFSVLMLFAAVPSKMALTGFGFFLVPVILARSNWDVADIARVAMLYPLVMVVVSPLAARLADALGWRAGLVALGGLVGGAGLLAPLLWPDTTLSMIVAIMALGVSHGLSASPQLALIPDVCWTECRSFGQANVLAFVRFAERAGSTIGPLLAAAFIPVWGLTGAVVGLGAVVLSMATVFAVAALAFGSGPHIETEEEAA
jgi:predicted MFS family arabinose efflux permease